MSENESPAVGHVAPTVVAPVTGDGEFDLASRRGEWVVLYFYPRANTPG